ncbi:MAG: alpha/beta fold hydrolase [Candidatus Aenigmatarchaeota archaeon]
MEKMYFENCEGKKLCGILEGPRTKKCIILCHGISVDKDELGVFTELSNKLVLAGFSTFRFDFTDSGESQGKTTDTTVTGETADIESAIKFMQTLGFEEFGLLAASFAGGPAMLVHDKRIKCIVLWNAIIDYHSILQPELPWPKKYFGKKAMEQLKTGGQVKIASAGFIVGKKLFDEIGVLEPWRELEKTNAPILFVHGDKDNYVPVEDSIKYSAMFGAELRIIKNGEHGLRNAGFQEASKTTIEFFKKNL